MADGGISGVSTGGGDFAGRDLTKMQITFSAGNLKELYKRFDLVCLSVYLGHYALAVYLRQRTRVHANMLANLDVCNGLWR